MTTLLRINTRLFADHGQSSLLANHFVAAFKARHPAAEIIHRDVAADPVPHLDARRFSAFTTPADVRSPEQAAVIAYSDALIDELKRADVIALGLPMSSGDTVSHSVGAGAAAVPAPAPPHSVRSESLAHFGVPSQLKSYFDHIARAGVTFQYTATGPKGLLTGKKAYVFAARGGLYAGTPLDTQTNYVRDFLRFIGIADVEFVHAEGLAIGADQKTAAIAKARTEIERLAA